MSDRAFVATRKGLFTVTRGAGGWKIARADFLGDQVPMILPDRRDGWLYAALGHGHFGAKFRRSPNGGDSWEEVAPPKYPDKPADFVESANAMNNNRPIPWSLELIWSLEEAGPDQPGTIWCGTLPGGLFRSRDRAASWEFIRSLWDHPLRKDWFGGGADWPGIHSICVDPRDSRRVALGVSCGGAWLSEDGGETWNIRAKGMRAEYMPPGKEFEENAQDPHRLVQCPAAPDAYWVQHHNGIFRSTDNLASWQEIKETPVSVFGFAVAVHPRDPNAAWFIPGIKDEKRIPVGGQVVVMRTRDGGRSFDVLRDGLPQEHAYDLVFRHALDVSADGERLIFGSTTGSVWISENGGDSWQCLSTHLPPVFCTRFG